MLLAGSGLMLRSFLTMYRMDIGIQTAHLVTTGMIIPARKLPGWEDRTRFLPAIDDRFASTTGIEAASTASAIPFGGGAVPQIEVDGRAATPGDRLPEVTMAAARRIPILRRDWSLVGPRSRVHERRRRVGTPGRHRQSTAGRGVFRGPESRRPRDPPVADTARNENAEWLTIVGLAANVRQRNNNQEREPDAVAYIPHRQNTTMARAATVLARTRTAPAQATRTLYEAMKAWIPTRPCRPD